MQEATETFTSLSECRNSPLDINAVIAGRSASCKDVDGAWPTSDNKSSTS